MRTEHVLLFFSALLLDDTSKRSLIPHVSDFMLLISSSTRAGLLLMVLQTLGTVSRAMVQMIANEYFAQKLLELQIILLGSIRCPIANLEDVCTEYTYPDTLTLNFLLLII